MVLDPQIAALLRETEALGLPPLPSLEPAAARRQLRERAPAVVPELAAARCEEAAAPGPAGSVRVRLYHPERDPPHAALVYFHGGGWVLGDLDTHHALAHALAARGGCLVASVDYRLAPEHPFPAAVEDACTATAWLVQNAQRLGVDRRRIAVGGDSAGGNLATVVARRARDDGGPALALQVLVYPVTDCDFETGSYRENATGYLLTREAMVWFWNHYLGAPGTTDHPDAAPLRAGDLSRLPPALILTAEYDPLRDEGEAYAERLRAAGVPVTLRRYPGMVHGFLRMTAAVDGARSALEEIATALRGL
jgi:acetyl esterase